MAKRDNAVAARVLAEAYFSTDQKVAEKHGITTRTITNYRTVLEKDPELSSLYFSCLDEIAHRDWADELSQTLTTALRKIGAKLEAVEADNLADITHLVGLTRELMELELSRKYAEHETRSNDRADDLGAQQTQGAARQTQDSRLLS